MGCKWLVYCQNNCKKRPKRVFFLTSIRYNIILKIHKMGGITRMSFTDINVRGFRMINDLGIEYDFLNPVFVFLAEYVLYLVLILTILSLFSKNKRTRIIGICTLLSIVVAEIIGKLVSRLHSNHQPFAELSNVNQLIEKAVDNSFPSDHTIIVFACCATFWIFRKGWSFLWLILAVLVGVSRMGVGVHYPADVITGAVISILSVLIVYRYVLKMDYVQKRFGVKADWPKEKSS